MPRYPLGSVKLPRPWCLWLSTHWLRLTLGLGQDFCREMSESTTIRSRRVRTDMRLEYSRFFVGRLPLILLRNRSRAGCLGSSDDRCSLSRARCFGSRAGCFGSSDNACSWSRAGCFGSSDRGLWGGVTDGAGFGNCLIIGRGAEVLRLISCGGDNIRCGHTAVVVRRLVVRKAACSRRIMISQQPSCHDAGTTCSLHWHALAINILLVG
jgi:hypothetical protein